MLRLWLPLLIKTSPHSLRKNPTLMRTRNFHLKWISILAILMGLAFATYEGFHWFTHVYEFDARIRSDMTRVSSRVNGTIENIHVKEGISIKKGDLLVTMKVEQIQERIRATEAELKEASAQKDKLIAEKFSLETSLSSRTATKIEQIQALKLDLTTLKDRLRLADKKLERSRYLFSKNLASRKNMENEQDNVLNLKGQIKAAEARIRVAELESKEILSRQAELAVFDQDIKIASITLERLKAKKRELEVDLSERQIHSPTDGIVDKIFKNPGEYVEDADELIIVHDPENVWVEANIVEDQIRHLEIGQPVKLHLNAYPFEMFLGEVIGIGQVTLNDLQETKSGSISNKARKIEQRIPVKIKILDKPKITAPGMLVEVNIQIRDRTLFK